MPKLRDLRTVHAGYARTGPNANTLRHPLPKSAAEVFEAFKDPATWKAFIGFDLEWTSPEPFGLGTTRTLNSNGQILEELFDVWDEGVIMGFHVTRTTFPVVAFSEEYELIATGDNSCELLWHIAFECGGRFGPLAGRGLAAFFAVNGRRSLKKLEAHLASS